MTGADDPPTERTDGGAVETEPMTESSAEDDPLISLNGVSKFFDLTVGVTDRILGREARPVRAVDDVNLDIFEGDVMGIAGESGCGKTTLGKVLVKLHDPTHGDLTFDGQDITTLDPESEREFRKRVQMIFQDPFESLNPRMTVFQSVVEPLRINDLPEFAVTVDGVDRYQDVMVEGRRAVGPESNGDIGVTIRDGAVGDVTVRADALVDREEVEVTAEEVDGGDGLRIVVEVDKGAYTLRREKTIQVLNDVGLSPAEAYLDEFPKELSGGERQRVAIARALVVDPDFIVADEPVSMLDVSIRAGVLNLMKELQSEYGLTYVFISHDLSLIRYMCDRTAIMYLGSIIEQGPTQRVVEDPQHPYTEALFDAVPEVDLARERQRANVSGEVPSPREPPSGCRFHPRCAYVIPPDSWTGSQDAFRRVFQFKRRAVAGQLDVEKIELEDPDPDRETLIEAVLQFGLRLEVPEEHRLDEETTSGVPPEALDLPAGAEGTLRQAAEAIVDGDPDRVEEVLEGEFNSRCSEDRPGLRPAGDQQAACHLYGETGGTAEGTSTATADD